MKRSVLRRTRIRRKGKPVYEWSLKWKGEERCRRCKCRATALHHVIPRSIGTPESAADLRNGIALCGFCHEGWHRREIVIHRELFTASEWEYLTGLVLTGREVMGYLDERYPPISEGVAA